MVTIDFLVVHLRLERVTRIRSATDDFLEGQCPAHKHMLR